MWTSLNCFPNWFSGSQFVRVNMAIEPSSHNSGTLLIYQCYHCIEKKIKRLLNEALKEGFVEVVIVVCIVLGQPGVGKTHLKYLLLDKRPPHLRTSTICAETPVRIEIRTIGGTRIHQTIERRWKEIDGEEMLNIIAKMILLAEPQFSQRSDQGLLSKLTDLFRSDSRGTAGAKLPTLNPKVKRVNHPATTPTLSNTCREAMREIMDKLLQRISKLRSEVGLDESSVWSLSDPSKWVYFTDSGGQPQYHELLPLFVRHISSALCVTRLTDKLDDIQAVEYYQEGKRVGTTQQSQLSAKDTIKCLVNTIQSYSAQDQPPKIMMVGTHLDKLEAAVKQSKCLDQSVPGDDVETLEDKDKKLLEMLNPEFSDQLVFYSSDMKKLIFPLNTLNPLGKEKAIAQSIRHAIEASGAKEVRIPIWWYIMELLLQELAKKIGRGVLSRAECLEMARLLHIKEDSFDAALEFFDELNVIKYSPDVLPNVVFIDSQIPLDKVSELVDYNYLLRQPARVEPSFPVEGEWRHFRDQGVVSKECLKQFKQHYVPNIFSVDDLSELLKKLLVFAPIPRPSWASTKEESGNEETHFIMPALLLTPSESELEKYRISSPALAALLVRFPRGSRRAGVFCCFVVHLIKHFGWSPLFDDTEPLYRNCIKMHLRTDPPCTVTLIDSNSLIEVYVEIAAGVAPTECASLLNVIKNAILSGIDVACIALNYKQTKPEFTFYCPHTRPTSPTSSPAGQSKELKQHTATLNYKKTYLCCDIVRGDAYRLQAKHLVWFDITQSMLTLAQCAQCLS